MNGAVCGSPRRGAIGWGMITTTINLPRELVAALDAIALRAGRSRSAWVGMIDDDGSLASTNVDEWMHADRQPMR